MSGKQPSGFNLTERSDSGDNRGTMPKPKRRGTQNLDQLERMSIENARLTKLDQRSRDLKEAREKFPRALSKSKWLDYDRKLLALRTEQSDTKRRAIEATLGFYDMRIPKKEKKRGELGEEITQHSSELERQRGNAQIAAKIAEDMSRTKAARESLEGIIKGMNTGTRNSIVKALIEGPDEFAAALHEKPGLRRLLQDSSELAALRALRPDIVESEEYLKKAIEEYEKETRETREGTKSQPRRGETNQERSASRGRKIRQETQLRDISHNIELGRITAEPDAQVTSPDTENRVEPSSSTKEIPPEGDETQRRESDKQAPAAYIPGSGWRGSPRQGLKGLVDDIIKTKIYLSNDRETLFQDIYTLYGTDYREHPSLDKPFPFDEQFVENIQCPEGWERKPTSHKPYIVFNNIIEHDRAKKEGYKHYKFIKPNIDPDRFREILPELLEKLGGLSYIGAIKVAKNIYEASRLFDNFVIGFHNPPGSTNKSDLEQHLHPYTKDTRAGHPAMADTISPQIQGIAFGDYDRGKGFGRTRCKPIERAIWILKERKQKITPETLLRETEVQLRIDGIDPNDPSKRLNAEE